LDDAPKINENFLYHADNFRFVCFRKPNKTMNRHIARPFREQIGSREIQRDIDLMRAIYDRRGPLNQRRHTITMDQWVGYSLLAVALLVPAIAAIIIKLLP
jgi:hypothetical protein